MLQSGARSGKHAGGPQREQFFVRATLHAAGSVVDIDKAHAGPIDQIYRIVRGIHGRAKAPQVIDASHPCRDVLSYAAVALERARLIEHRIPADRDMLLGAIQAEARELEIAERPVRVEYRPVRPPAGLVRSRIRYFPATPANLRARQERRHAAQLPVERSALREPMLGVGLPVEVG